MNEEIAAYRQNLKKILAVGGAVVGAVLLPGCGGEVTTQTETGAVGCLSMDKVTFNLATEWGLLTNTSDGRIEVVDEVGSGCGIKVESSQRTQGAIIYEELRITPVDVSKKGLVLWRQRGVDGINFRFGESKDYNWPSALNVLSGANWADTANFQATLGIINDKAEELMGKSE